MTTYRFTNRDGAVTTKDFNSDEEAIEHSKWIERQGLGVRIERQKWDLVEYRDAQKA
ncbi:MULTISPECIES: hypothetical protein [unclassified Rhodococcus (in: high G+C Gram-positive bacteria)]|uniref:hypothetical protein n=1 Tax=unclassified Rhodococcus (in: high G+C Gram-positive bacteria) TaxID=192944 RepID=UPI0015C65A45|nr:MULTISPECIES: hypothetical protein [unclassified Rhodococcus (in: high G+C Gram-positive bacteria)]